MEMDEFDASDVKVEGFSVFGLLLAFSLIATFLFAVYWLWGCSCSEGVIENKGSNPIYRSPKPMNQAVVPLYAFEIEPGTVVLQSGDGEIFRILLEYDSVGRTGTGSPPLYASITTSRSSNDFHYMPPYTRAHFQTRPSAPDYENHNGRRDNPETQRSSDDYYDEVPPQWAPITLHSN